MITKGSRVMVFDHLLFKNDVKTPLSFTARPATVVCRRMTEEEQPRDVVDVLFDHRPETVSRGHFVDMIKLIEDQP